MGALQGDEPKRAGLESRDGHTKPFGVEWEGFGMNEPRSPKR